MRLLYPSGIIRLALVLGILASACIAEAAAPVYQGSITSPTLCSPRGIAFAPGGGLFVGSDCHALSHMERFNAAGDFVGSWAFPAQYLGPPNGVAVDGAGNVYVIDMFNTRILKFTSAGVLITSWPSVVQSAVDLAVDSFGDLYVAEMDGKRVRKTTSSGMFLAAFGSSGTTPGKFQNVTGAAVDGSGRVYATDNVRVRVVRFLANGTFDMEFAPPSRPSDVAVGPDGNLYVLSDDPNVHAAYQYSPGGVLLQSFSSPLGLEQAYRIIIDSAGMIFISEQNNNQITKFQIDMSTPAVPMTFGRLKATYR